MRRYRETGTKVAYTVFIRVNMPDFLPGRPGLRKAIEWFRLYRADLYINRGRSAVWKGGGDKQIQGPCRILIAVEHVEVNAFLRGAQSEMSLFRAVRGEVGDIGRETDVLVTQVIPVA